MLKQTPPTKRCAPSKTFLTTAYRPLSAARRLGGRGRIQNIEVRVYQKETNWAIVITEY